MQPGNINCIGHRERENEREREKREERRERENRTGKDRKGKRDRARVNILDHTEAMELEYLTSMQQTLLSLTHSPMQTQANESNGSALIW